MFLGKFPLRKIAPPSPNSNANPKPNPDPEQGQFSSGAIFRTPIFCNYFVIKRSLNNTPYRKFSLNCKQHFKTRKELNLRKNL